MKMIHSQKDVVVDLKMIILHQKQVRLLVTAAMKRKFSLLFVLKQLRICIFLKKQYIDIYML